jgi:3'-5' exoribonuclease
VFKVQKKSRTQARSGKAFLQVTLVDKTGELDARVFDKVDELAPLFAERDYVLVEGGMISFHGKPQLVIERLEKLDPEPIDPAEFELKAAPAAEERGIAPERMRELVDKIHDPQLRALVKAIIEDPEVSAGLRVAHGPRGTAFAHRGGAADHLASLAKLAMRVGEHFPSVDRDLVAAGAMVQELGRVRGAAGDKAYEATDQGRLVGAAACAAQLIREKARAIDGFPTLLEQHLTHLAIAGRSVPPATVEALVVTSARELHERMSGWLETMARDAGGPRRRAVEGVRSDLARPSPGRGQG